MIQTGRLCYLLNFLDLIFHFLLESPEQRFDCVALFGLACEEFVKEISLLWLAKVVASKPLNSPTKHRLRNLL